MGKISKEDKELDLIIDEVESVIRQPKTKTTKQTGKIDMNKEAYKKAKADHNAEINKLKDDIKRHKLLKKQAKIMYKLTQMKASK